MMSVMRLIIDPNARFEGEVLYKGRDLMKLTQDQMRAMRGSGDRHDLPGPDDLAEPGVPVGWQIAEQIRAHEQISKQAARARAVELLGRGRHPACRASGSTTTRTSSPAACASA